MSYKSFSEQTKHYFSREHSDIPNEPVTGSANWLSAEMRANRSAWTYILSSANLDEIKMAVDLSISESRELRNISGENFLLPKLSHQITSWRQNIAHGSGLMLIKGLPVNQWTMDEIERAYWGLGHHLGVPGGQNPKDELLGHVTDLADTQIATVRLYRTNAEIKYHCDAADIVGLLCLNPAKTGGQSRIVSTVAIFNAMLARRPSLIPRLFKPFRLDVREGTSTTTSFSAVTPCCYHHGQLKTFYHSDYFRSVERHSEVSLTPEERSILDFYDQLGSDPKFYLDMWLEPGDMQFISNHTVAHARTAYEDFEEIERKRHLLRLWLSV